MLKNPFIINDKAALTLPPPPCLNSPHPFYRQPVTYSGCLGDHYTNIGTQDMVPKKHFLSFLFSVAFQKKYVETAIIDFTMHLIILKWLRRQKCRQKRKILRKKEVEAKEETVNKSVFIHLNK